MTATNLPMVWIRNILHLCSMINLLRCSIMRRSRRPHPVPPLSWFPQQPVWQKTWLRHPTRSGVPEFIMTSVTNQNAGFIRAVTDLTMFPRQFGIPVTSFLYGRQSAGTEKTGSYNDANGIDLIQKYAHIYGLDQKQDWRFRKANHLLRQNIRLWLPLDRVITTIPPLHCPAM